MSAIEEIRKMKQGGMTEQEIVDVFRQRGIPEQEIDDALSQSQIKEAVMASPQEGVLENEENIPTPPDYQGQENFPVEETGAPMMNQEQYPAEAMGMAVPQPSGEEVVGPYSPEENYPQDASMAYSQGAYPQTYGYQQQYSQGGVSADTISEIAEQVVSEKLTNIREKLEKATDLKTKSETELANIDERLQRIEKIIDRLQLSILQKVGEYGANVSDLKKEVIETQKSFTAITKHHGKSGEHHHEKSEEHKHLRHKHRRHKE